MYKIGTRTLHILSNPCTVLCSSCLVVVDTDVGSGKVIFLLRMFCVYKLNSLNLKGYLGVFFSDIFFSYKDRESKLCVKNNILKIMSTLESMRNISNEI